MHIGTKVKIKIDGEWKSGTIVNIYILQDKCNNLADIDVNGKIIYGIETKDLMLDD